MFLVTGVRPAGWDPCKLVRSMTTVPFTPSESHEAFTPAFALAYGGL